MLSVEPIYRLRKLINQTGGDEFWDFIKAYLMTSEKWALEAKNITTGNYLYSRFTGKCNTLRHWSSLYPLPGQGLQVKANVANLFEMTIFSRLVHHRTIFKESLQHQKYSS